MTETIVETIEEELERFRDKLAEGVAIGTEMSAPAYLFSMMGPIVTINKRLMNYAMEKLQPEDPQGFKGTYNDIYFKRISEIKSFPPGQEYYRKHLKSSHFRPARNTIGSITSGRSRTGKESGSGSDS